MKFVIPLSITMFINFNPIMPLLLFSMMFIFWNMFFLQTSKPLILDNLFFLDPISFMMIFLSFFSTILIMMISQPFKKKNMLILLIFNTLLICFSSSSIMLFYIFFEIVLIPTLILITQSGYQPERLQAGIYLLMYTIVASLPLLLLIINLKYNSNFYSNFILAKNLSYPMIILLPFLVKLPMFFFHLWLPKAHVEAPVEGSMILAAILLKLGGYGILRFIPSLINSINKFNFWFISLSMMGAIMTSINCTRQKDLKSLVAYSSVAHMGFILSSMLTNSFLGIFGSIIMMVGHGFSSSALFLLTNTIYSKYHTRNIISFKGLINLFPNVTFWWFLFMAVNISAPPSINLLSEIFMMSSLIQWNLSLIFAIFLVSMSTATFSIFMFVNSIHNISELLPSNTSFSKIFLTLFIHLFILIFMILKLEIGMFLNISLTKTMICGIMNSQMKNKILNLMLISISSLVFSFYLFLNSMFISIQIPLLSMFNFQINLSFILDWLSMIFLATVLFISSMIVKFSMIYIPKNQHSMFIALLLMFVLSMSILILSNNIVFMLLGWDGLGLSSYILVIYYQNSNAAYSGTITILSNRIGDILILISIALLFSSMNWNFFMNENFSKLTMLMLTIAAMTKSAQFPFSAWLPAAMSAPTPISALVHSSTLVTAGVYFLIRIMSFNHPSSMFFLMIMASFTAIFSSLSALWEQDMKKIIALSTLSQMALMMFTISLNSINSAFFHLISHALFKSMMFLCAGILIHNFMYQDMRHMGLSLNSSPTMISMFLISNLSLMGTPFLSGFFSKDLIIEKMIHSKLISILVIFMILSISLTSMYSIRMLFSSLKFLKKSKTDSTLLFNKEMENPTIIMSSFAIMVGFIFLWIFLPHQMFIMPFYLKISILLSFLMGIILSISFEFTKSKYWFFSEFSISLWFSYILYSHISIPFNSSSKLFFINDKNWQETYGPKSIFSLMVLMSKFPKMLMLKSLSILLFTLLIPMILLM